MRVAVDDQLVVSLDDLSPAEAKAIANQIESRANERKNGKFVQVTIPEGARALRALGKKNAGALRLYLLLMEYMSGQNTVVASQVVLSEALGVSTRTISRWVKSLVDVRLLTVLKAGTTNVYALNADVVWRSWSTGKKYAKLQGSVLLSETENEEALRQLRLFAIEKRNGGEK